MNPQDIASKYGATFTAAPTSTPNVSTSATDVSSIASKYGATFTPLANSNTAQEVTQEQPENKSILQKIGDFFTGSTQKFGKTIGKSIAAPANSDLYSQALQQHDALVLNLQKAIADKQAQGGDVTNLVNTLNTYKQNTPKQEDFTGNVINKSAEQVLGEAAGTGLETLSGGLLESGVANAASSASLGSKLLKGARIGATIGAIGGASNAMQDNKSFGGVATDAAIGGVAGGVLGGATEGLVAGISGATKLGKKLISPTNLDKIEALQNVAKKYEEALNLTPSQKTKEANLLAKTGDNVYTTIAKINKPIDQIPAELERLSNEFAEATQKAVKSENNLFNISEIERNALKDAESRIPSAVSAETAKKRIQSEIETMLKDYKGTMTPDKNGDILVGSDFVEKLRKAGNSMTPFNASDPEKVGQSTGYALANAVRDQVEKQGSFPAYRQANREWGAIIHAQEVLSKLENANKKRFKVLGGLGGKISRQVLSGALGYHTGGLGGAVLSEIGSEYAAEIISNPSLKSYFDRKIAEKAGMKQTPAIIEQLNKEIKDYIDQSYSRIRIPQNASPEKIYVSKSGEAGKNLELVRKSEQALQQEKLDAKTSKKLLKK